MGVTLKLGYLSLIICLLFVECKSKKKQTSNIPETSSEIGKSFFDEMEAILTKEQWIDDFKKIAYYKLLKRGYKNDPKLLHELFEVADVSHFEPYYGDIYSSSFQNIESHMKKEYDDIIQDSIVVSTAFRPHPGKRVLLKALNFYTSELLDSLAKEEYKKWQKLPREKRDSIYGLISG
ncbi:hypothetical protein [Sphingobacterium hotanense]|uniref:Uncharacterized protein n=1 Tax=Sphingobacterium hotanense TaxID=649196 RepID=A0ABT7NIZ4_9SPHI|nr:hypothetical protein [Sphingobacterium hotanense]MDM1047164.1 hypothetical protein [Sphingobacterium hotanense]